MTTSASAQTPISVVHSTNVWLSQTMTWLDTQVRFLPQRVQSHVVCDHAQNLDQFPVRGLISADHDSAFWRLIGSHSWQIQKRRQLALRIRCARRFNAQILHSHFGDQGWFDLRAAARARLKHVVTFYGYDASRLPQTAPIWNRRYLELFERVDLVVCEGPHLGGALIALGCPPEKVKIHHLGLDLERIPFSPRSWQPGRTLRALVAGSFTEKKGIPYALEALGRISGKVDVEVTLIGDADHQPRNKREKARILQALRSANLESRTRMLGYQPYSVLLEEASRCHIFLSPSVTAEDGDTEGGAPVSIIEMAASGMPVISTHHCDIPEVLEDGVTGLLTSERSVDGLASKLDWLIQNPDRWHAMTTAARKHVELEFNAETQGRRLAQSYELLTNR